MNEPNRANLWKLTAIGVVVAAVSAIVTGLVVANRAPAPTQEARVESPSAAPTAVVTPPAAPAPPVVAQTPAPTPADAPKPATPSRDDINACNRQASNTAG